MNTSHRSFRDTVSHVSRLDHAPVGTDESSATALTQVSDNRADPSKEDARNICHMYATDTPIHTAASGKVYRPIPRRHTSLNRPSEARSCCSR